MAKLHGEEYRISLERLARDLDLGDHVVFDDRFLDIEDLASMLAATTIYLTPYRSREQIVSGALTFAIVAGCPTVSTPYYYAEDLLASGAGVLVPFDDPAALAAAVTGLLDDPRAARADACRGAARSAPSWPGRRSAARPRTCCARRSRSARRAIAPPPAAGHAAAGARLAPADAGRRRRDRPARRRQRARCAPPATASTTSRAWRSSRSGSARTTGAETYHADAGAQPRLPAPRVERRAGGMRNFMAYDRRWLDEPHGGDHLGRAAWALGEVVAAEPVPALLGAEPDPAARDAAGARRAALAADDGLRRARPRPRRPGAGRRRRRPPSCATSRTGSPPCCARTRHRDWYWSEDVLTYDNARLPQALIAAGARLGDDDLVRRGRARARLVRGASWTSTAPTCSSSGTAAAAAGEPRTGHGDEQPLDAAALVEAEVEAFVVTGEPERARARRSAPSSGSSAATGSRRPSTTSRRAAATTASAESAVNANQGAESTLAYLQALLALDAAGLQATLPE